MRLPKIIYLLLVFLTACQITESVEKSSPLQVLEAHARISPKDQAMLLLEADTLLAGDTIIFQGDIYPSRGTKTNDHWWEIDGILRREEFAFKYSFTEAGLHQGVFHVVDRFGDTLRDTCSILVSRLPAIFSLQIPFKGSALVDGRSPSGIHFAWDADSGGAAPAQYRFRLWADPCQSIDTKTLLLDSTLSTQSLDWWKPLSELCPFTWIVQVSNSLGFTGSFALESHFSTKSNSPITALQWYSEKDSLLLTLQRIGDTNIDSITINKGIQRIDGLQAGEYKRTLFHPFRTGYLVDSSQFYLSPGLLTDIGSLTVMDLLAPQIKCPLCYTDTLNYLFTDLKFPVTEKGSGIAEAKLMTYINGVQIPSQWKQDTLTIPSIQWNVSEGIHTLQILIQDNDGNLQSQRYWLVVPE